MGRLRIRSQRRTWAIRSLKGANVLVYIYALGALPGAVPIAQGPYAQGAANSLHVTIGGGGLAPGLALGTHYQLALGGVLQNANAHGNGYPTPGQLMNADAAGVHSFIV
jgi:hypothetical protein